LYEKIKIQQSTLSKGQIQYRDRLNEIRVLKIKLNDLKRELHILKSSVANIDVLKREVHQLGRELLQERTKVRIHVIWDQFCHAPKFLYRYYLGRGAAAA